jgi:hypothetical protein
MELQSGAGRSWSRCIIYGQSENEDLESIRILVDQDNKTQDARQGIITSQQRASSRRKGD